jgi:thiaminase/transcriptional activator TenA
VRGAAADLWRQSRDLADACLAHPFVQGIASGELAPERFRVYVAQDATFLESFARAYGLALARSPDREGIGVLGISWWGLRGAPPAPGLCARWGILLSPEPLAATSAYCDFLLATASLEPAGHTVAAMTPCMRLYAFLGQELVPKLNPESRYREWVETYSSAEVEALAARLEALLDRYGGDPARLARLYRRAMELELAFFQSVWEAG